MRILPDLGNGLVLVGLVDNLGNDLGALFDQTGIGRGELGAVDGIGRGIFDEQGKQGRDAADEEGEDEEVDEQKDDDAATHDVGWDRALNWHLFDGGREMNRQSNSTR